MRILAAGAHPDDLELLCAGTLAKCRKRGDEIFMAYLCKGDKGHLKIPAEKLARIRKKEAENSAQVIGVKIQGGYFPDLEIYLNRQTMHKVIQLMRTVRPEMIITHSPDDYMTDHTTTSRLIVDASFIATLPIKRSRKPQRLFPRFSLWIPARE